MRKSTGVVRNIAFAFASFLLLFYSTAVQAFEKDEIVFCAGPEGQSYHKLALELQKAFKDTGSKIKFSIVVTNGGPDNMKKIKSGECNAGITLRAFAEKAGFLIVTDGQKAYGHLVCHRSVKASNLDDLPMNTRIAIGHPDSTSAATFVAFGELEKNYSRFTKLLPIAFSEAINGMVGNDSPVAQCAFSMMGVGTSAMSTVENNSAWFKMVEIKDSDLDDTGVFELVQLKASQFSKKLRSWSDYDTVAAPNSIFVLQSMRSDQPGAFSELMVRADDVVQRVFTDKQKED